MNPLPPRPDDSPLTAAERRETERAQCEGFVRCRFAASAAHLVHLGFCRTNRQPFVWVSVTGRYASVLVEMRYTGLGLDHAAFGRAALTLLAGGATPRRSPRMFRSTDTSGLAVDVPEAHAGRIAAGLYHLAVEGRLSPVDPATIPSDSPTPAPAASHA